MPSRTVQTLILKTRCCNLKRVQAPGRDRWGLWQPPKWKPSWLSIGSLTLCRDLDPTWPGLLIFRGTKEYYWLLIFFFLWNFWFSLWQLGSSLQLAGSTGRCVKTERGARVLHRLWRRWPPWMSSRDSGPFTLGPEAVQMGWEALTLGTQIFLHNGYLKKKKISV